MRLKKLVRAFVLPLSTARVPVSCFAYAKFTRELCLSVNNTNQGLFPV